MIEYLPPHIHRVHPYAGGLSELFAWPHEGVSEVVNDLNGDLTNFWKVLQNPLTFEEFQRQCEAMPFSQVEWEQSKHPDKVLTVEAAVDFFVRIRQSRQGLGKDFGTLTRNRVRRGMNEQASAWLSVVEGLPDAHDRLKRVVVIHKPALEVIRQQDGPNTFFYCDPPYVHSTRVTTDDYEFEMTEEQHQELIDLLVTIEGKAMVSMYHHPIYDALSTTHGWRIAEFEMTKSSSSKSKKEKAVECVWMNYTK